MRDIQTDEQGNRVVVDPMGQGGGPQPRVATPPEEKTRRVNIALNAEVEEVLRAVSGRTGIPMAALRQAIEESPQVATAAKQVLRYRYDVWVNDLKGAEDIFGRTEKEG